jgi:hypothetical protein
MIKQGLVLFAVAVATIGMVGTLKAGPNYQLPPYSPRSATFGPVPAAPASAPGAQGYAGGNKYEVTGGVQVPVGSGTVNGGVSVSPVNGAITGVHGGVTVPVGN